MSAIRARALAEALAVCREEKDRPPGYGGQWEGYGGHRGAKTGPECAAGISALRLDDAEELGLRHDLELERLLGDELRAKIATLEARISELEGLS